MASYGTSCKASEDCNVGYFCDKTKICYRCSLICDQRVTNKCQRLCPDWSLKELDNDNTDKIYRTSTGSSVVLPDTSDQQMKFSTIAAIMFSIIAVLFLIIACACAYIMWLHRRGSRDTKSATKNKSDCGSDTTLTHSESPVPKLSLTNSVDSQGTSTGRLKLAKEPSSSTRYTCRPKSLLNKAQQKVEGRFKNKKEAIAGIAISKQESVEEPLLVESQRFSFDLYSPDTDQSPEKMDKPGAVLSNVTKENIVSNSLPSQNNKSPPQSARAHSEGLTSGHSGNSDNMSYHKDENEEVLDLVNSTECSDHIQRDSDNVTYHKDENEEVLDLVNSTECSDHIQRRTYQYVASNKRLYEKLKKIEWVMGYHSSGQSIDVFVNLEDLDPRDVEKKLAEKTGAPTEKFHVKDVKFQNSM